MTTDIATRKRADLAGPGISTYEEVERVLPRGYRSALTPRETQDAIFHLRRHIEDQLCKELNLMMVQVPLIVSAESGLNDMLDRDQSRTPVSFHISNDRDAHHIEAQVVQAATKWKRTALKQFAMSPGEGVCTDMRAVRKDYFLDHDHSAYVDQWDWERAIEAKDRNLDYLKSTVRSIWKALCSAEDLALELYPQLNDKRYALLPRDIEFFHAEDVLAMYPDLPRKERETKLLQKCQAAFIIGIGWTLDDGHPHELRAADYDDWSTEVVSPDGKMTHGLNGDILVWNPLTKRRHELSSMGIRVDGPALRRQLEITRQTDWLKLPYDRGIVEGTLPLSIGGGIGQSRTLMLLLRKAHLGEVSVTVWPEILTEMCKRYNIHVIE